MNGQEMSSITSQSKDLNSKEFLSHLIHIGFNLSIFQSKYGFMHNDMHAMNIYLLDTFNMLPTLKR